MQDSLFTLAAAATVIIGLAIAYVRSGRAARDSVEILRSELQHEQESVGAQLATVRAGLDYARQRVSPPSDGAASLVEVMDRLAGVESAVDLAAREVERRAVELEADLAEAAWLAAQVRADTEYGSLSETELDIRLLELIALSMRTDVLAQKYSSRAADRVSKSLQRADEQAAAGFSADRFFETAGA